MRKANSPSWLVAVILTVGSISTPGLAQIIPDTTLPNNSIVLPDGNLFTINGGTEAGSNLFHSFQDFSIPTGGEAFFNNAQSIDNIITRVTGGNISDIDGLIRANGGANLFLINPNGIQFGPNARLEIGGSFLGSTAESLLFEDGRFYSATEPNAPPFLTVNVPVGLQMGSNPGGIEVRGAIAPPDPIATVGDIDSFGLQLSPNQTFALIGGPLDIVGGNLRVEGGRIELGSVAGKSLLGLLPVAEGWTVNYDGATNFGDLHIDGSSTLRLSGAGGGSIALTGRNLTIDGESNLLAETLSSRDGGTIAFRASEDIALLGNSFVSATTFGSGNAGSIELQGRSIFVEQASDFEAETRSLGNAGRIIAAATDTILLNERGRISTATIGAGRGGSIDLSAGTIVLDNSSRVLNPSARIDGVSNPNLPIGHAGQINFTADTLIIRGGSGPNIATSSDGNGGQVNMRADSILMEDRSFIAAVTRDSGRGGEINITANSLTVRDNSGFGSRVRGTGDGGQLNLDVGFILFDRSGLGTDTRSSGNGGDIDIRADVMVLRNQGNLQSSASGSGNAGTVGIEVGELILDEGSIELQSTGAGNAGTLEVVADSIQLDNESSMVATVVSGDGGNLIINSNNLLLRGGSQITTSATGTATGGNIRLDTDLLAALDDSDLTANAVLGTGGNIDIVAQGIFLSPNSQITASSQFGIDGVVSINNPIVDPVSGLVALDADPLNPNTQLQDSCEIATKSRFTITGNGGLPEDPTQSLQPPIVWRDTRLGEIPTQLTPNSPETELEEASVSTVPLVEATGWRRNERGQIELVAALDHLSYSSWQSHLDCDAISQDAIEPDS